MEETDHQAQFARECDRILMAMVWATFLAILGLGYLYG